MTREKYNNNVHLEQVRLLYEALPTSLFATILNSTILVVILWSEISHDYLGSWLIFMAIVSLIRWVLYKKYFSLKTLGVEQNKEWETRFLTGSSISGLLWGISPILFYSQDITYQVVNAFVLAGMSAGAVTTLSYRSKAINLFLLFALTPLIVIFISSGEFMPISMGIMVIIFIALLSISSKRIYNNSEQNIALRLDSESRKNELENNLKSLQAFHKITTSANTSFEEKIHQLLSLGLKTFKLDMGIVSHIHNDVYTVEYIVGPDKAPEPGAKFDFKETYCSQTFLRDGPVGFHHVAHSEIGSHPCYQSFKLEAYLGTPLFVNNRRYGTLNFSSSSPRENVFSENDMSMIQLFAQWIGNELARTTSEQQLSQFKTTLDLTRDCVFMFDPVNLRYFYVNQGAMEQVGYSYNELLSMTPVDIKPEFTSEQFTRMIETLITGEETSIEFETVHQHKNGSRIPVDIVLQYIAPENETPRFVAIVRDITERKRIDNMKNEFISTVSHELRTPLTSIRGSIGLITGGATGDIPDKVMEMLTIANNNTERLLLLINDILDLQKIESGKMEFRFKYLDLYRFLEQAIEENEGYATEYNVAFSLLCENKDIVIYADHERLMQVMSNLLSNAAKFSPSGASVDVKCQIVNNHIRISVTDYGEGIPKDFQKMLFDKFTQADSSDSKRLGGSGLGLSITKRIVEKHGGIINFDSQPGSGTTFYFDLPASPTKH